MMDWRPSVSFADYPYDLNDEKPRIAKILDVKEEPPESTSAEYLTTEGNTATVFCHINSIYNLIYHVSFS